MAGLDKQEPGKHGKQAKDHGKRIVEQHATLDIARQTRKQANRFCSAVNQRAVNNCHVALLPQLLTKLDAAIGKHC